MFSILLVLILYIMHATLYGNIHKCNARLSNNKRKKKKKSAAMLLLFFNHTLCTVEIASIEE